jgi:tetratricopeptide (TPR) repeat protein
MLLVVLALVFPPNTSDVHKHGVDLYRQQQYAQAIAALSDAVRGEEAKSAEYKESVLLIGQSYFMLSQAPKAIPWLEKVPTVNEANYMLGYAYLQTGQREQAETAFARLFAVAADSAAGHLLAGQMMLKKEYEAEALAEVNKALLLDAKLPEAHYLLGEVAIFRGRLEEGITEMHRELELNPNFSMAWYRLGDAYTRQQSWEHAIPNLQRAVWLNAEFSGPYILLGKCYYKMHDWKNAEGILRRAVKLDPNNHAATYLLGQTLMADGKTAEGRALLKTLTPADASQELK